MPSSVGRSLLLLPFLSGCAGGPTDGDPDGIDLGADIALELVVAGLENPLYLTAPPDDPRLFIVEQTGRILIVDETGALLEDPFLDLTAPVNSSGNERGLLSVAFHPDYAANGQLYVNYTGVGGRTVVERYTVSASDPSVADPGSAELVLEVDQPFANHNGGLNVFGPDGMLYIGLGDGGSGGDPQGNGQDVSTLLGSMLRIDVDGASPYQVPSGNPFVDVAGARGEIWAYGLRNPWRFSFDLVGGHLYIADVGQNQWEEVNRVPAGATGVNYGWNEMEGLHCFGSACEPESFTLPILEYSHDDGCSVTGGFVYRGSAIPELAGWYVFADYCSGWIRAISPAGVEPMEIQEWDWGLSQITSFGTDSSGEIYVVTRSGSVFRIVSG